MHGMMLGKKKFPQADKSNTKAKNPGVGPDDNSKTKFGGQTTSPKLPDRDGPAKSGKNGKDAGKPPTSAKAKSSIPPKTLKSMKANIAKMM